MCSTGYWSKGKNKMLLTMLNVVSIGALVVALYLLRQINLLEKRMMSTEFALLELIFESDPELAEQHKDLREWINADHD